VLLRLAVSLATVTVALAGSGSSLTKAEAYVDKRCPAAERGISKSMWIGDFGFNALYGNCRAGDGRDQHIWFFEHGRFVGLDAATSSHDIVALWRDDRTIVVMYVLYRQTDAECCPTGGGATVRFRWNGKRVVRLDPLPPRAFMPGVRAGR
jgi:hypothetical protein